MSTSTRMGRLRTRTTIGASLMLASLATGLALALVTPPAFAAETVEPPKLAFFNGRVSEAPPKTVTNEVPPGAVCIVEPRLCPENVKQNIGDPLAAEVQKAQAREPAKPFDPVQPGDLPASIAYGKPYYRSALQFPVSTLPDGKEYGEFKVTFTESDPTYAASSPALRQFVLAVFASIAAGGPSETQFQRIREEAPIESELPGLEACPIVDDPSTPDVDESQWEAGASQSEDAIPFVDCTLGTTAIRDAEAGTWTFDLALAATAWGTGEIPNNGIVIRTTGAPNFAFGDADTSTNKQVTLVGETITVASSQRDASSLATFDFGSELGGDFGGDFGGGEAAGGFDAGSGSAFGGDSGGFAMGPDTSGGFSSDSGAVESPVADEPAVAAPDEPAVADEGDALAVPPTEVAGVSQPGSAWYVWLLVPIFLAGAYLVTGSLLLPATAAAGGAVAREGAMTRLIRRQEALRVADSPELVRF